MTTSWPTAERRSFFDLYAHNCARVSCCVPRVHLADPAANADAIAALLAAGAAPTAVDSNARAPLHRCAAAPGGAQCARLLLEAGAPIAMRDRAEQSALHFCARSGDAETMKVLASA